MRQYFDINPHGTMPHKELWLRKTELIIALVSVIFSISIALLYKGGVKVAEASRHAAIVQAVIFIFPFICIARLIYVRMSKPVSWFGWLSPAIDIAVISSIIYVFSLQYGTAAASFKAPTFAFYFVIIALHSMRFQPNQTLFSGFMAALCWAVMIGSFKISGIAVTHNYLDFVQSSELLLGAEIERMIALMTFSGFLAIGAQRTRKLMAYEKDREIEVAKINHQANLAHVQLEEMQKASQMKSDFLDTMSHEMRTPMNGVMGMIQVLETTNLDDRQRHMLNVMDQSSEAMLKIIQDILDFATVNGDDNITLKSELFNFKDVLQTALTPSKQQAKDKGLDFLVQIDPDVPDALQGDAHYFSLIIDKLMANAVKFTEKGYIRLHVENKTPLNMAGQDSTIRVTVQDTGIGMSKTEQAAIFNAFSQADTSKTRAYGGMGIGLSLVHKLIHAMGSEITLSSKTNKGTSFSFDLKWSPPQDEESQDTQTPLTFSMTPQDNRTETTGEIQTEAIPTALPFVNAKSVETVSAQAETVSVQIDRPEPQTPSDDKELLFENLDDILNALNQDESFMPSTHTPPLQKKQA